MLDRFAIDVSVASTLLSFHLGAGFLATGAGKAVSYHSFRRHVVENNRAVSSLFPGVVILEINTAA